jgi:UDP-2-acetamido-3-amino-2,3-dideoxy-glucuronate N-acetyltransferase
MMAPRIHSTASIEEGVSIGDGTSIWDNVHVRGPNTSIGEHCIVGEKTYISYDVQIGNLCKINSFVYICALVTLEDGVMCAARVTFTNDRYPRAALADLSGLASSDVDDDIEATIVRQGATLGASSTIGLGLEIGRFAMVGMGSVVTRSIPDFHLVTGVPARTIAAVCRCGHPIARATAHRLPDGRPTCAACGRSYSIEGNTVTELAASTT